MSAVPSQAGHEARRFELEPATPIEALGQQLDAVLQLVHDLRREVVTAVARATSAETAASEATRQVRDLAAFVTPYDFGPIPSASIRLPGVGERTMPSRQAWSPGQPRTGQFQ